MSITKQEFGVLSDGTEVSLYKIQNEKMVVCVSDFGCTITSILLPKKNGGFDDVLLGYSTLDGYLNCPGLSFGTVVGRFANRIGGAKFSVNGKEYPLDKNDNSVNTLHGGFVRWDHMVWEAKPVTTKSGEGIAFSRVSEDGEQGFPGNVKMTVTYTLSSDNKLTLEYKAETDSATPINITNHAYFNLSGNGTVLNHELELAADGVLEVDSGLIPTGKILPVAGTPYDFTAKKALGKDISKIKDGYDNCYVTCVYGKDNCGLPYDAKNVTRIAVLSDPATGRKMTVETNLEGMQLYTANWIDGIAGKYGRRYKKHEAVCLETQCFPDSPNKSSFPTCILEPGKVYDAVTVYGFEF